MVWVLDKSEARLGARLVLLTLAEYAHDDGTKAFPSVETISRKARLSERGTQDALRKLEADGMIRKTGTTRHGTSIYTVVMDEPGVQNPHPRSPAQEGVQNDAQTTLQTAPDPTTGPITGPVSVSRAYVIEAWRAKAPPLIAHRESYFKDETVGRKIDKAAAKYGLVDVAAAIYAYAAVLESDEHFFNYRWTLADFLTRGLDRFVPESDPHTTFRKNSGGSKADRVADNLRWLEGLKNSDSSSG